MKNPTDDRPGDKPELDDAPPLLGSWRNIYALEIGVLVVLVIVFSVLTVVYS